LFFSLVLAFLVPLLHRKCLPLSTENPIAVNYIESVEQSKENNLTILSLPVCEGNTFLLCVDLPWLISSFNNFPWLISSFNNFK
jgi:hypothetical protein